MNRHPVIVRIVLLSSVLLATVATFSVSCGGGSTPPPSPAVTKEVAHIAACNAVVLSNIEAGASCEEIAARAAENPECGAAALVRLGIECTKR